MTSAIAPQADPPICSLCALMAFERDRSLEELEEFVSVLELDDRQGSLGAWQRFASRLTKRLDVEEQLLVPSLAVERPTEAARLLAQHEALRTALRRLGANLELHLLRAEHLRQLLKLLRAHSQQAEALYAWAELHLDREDHRRVLHAVQHQADDYGMT